MHFNSLTLPLLASLWPAVHASPTPRASSLSWSPCSNGKNVTSVLQCADLDVPRDYTNENSDETITLKLARLPAKTQPSKGSVFLNTGGPGIPQRSGLLGAGGQAYQLLTGGEYDIVTFDPRGTGETLPFSCYNSSEERTAASTGIPNVWTASDAALGLIWASRQVKGARCLLQEPEVGELLGTAFVARDIMRVVDVLEDDGMVRFLGFSYGTALGATLAAMFPDRIDKMLLDGVLNMDQYYAGREVQQVVASEATWAGFFAGCMEAPDSLCALKRHASSAKELQTIVEDLIKAIKFAPVPLGPYAPYELVDYSTLKSLIFNGIYYPSQWTYMAGMLNGIMTANVTQYLDSIEVLAGTFADGTDFPIYNGPEALQGIRCGETAFRTENVTDLVPTLDTFRENSWVIGDAESSAIYVSCAAWQMDAKEVYSGGFQGLKTKNPILFVGSPYDPLTAFAGAQNTSAAFEGSGLLQHDGYGHCSISQASVCTAKAYQAYFKDGTLPDPGTVCKPEIPIFPLADDLLLDVLNQTTKRSVQARAEDVQLLKAMRDLGGLMVRQGQPI